VLIRVPVFRDRDFRIFKPILRKGFESEPDPQIPQKRSVTVVTKYAERMNTQNSTKNYAKKKIVPKVDKICEISGHFGCFLPGNKDSNPCLEDPDFLSLAKKGQRDGSLNPNPWIRNNTTTT
jgi:hypothetical protein